MRSRNGEPASLAATRHDNYSDAHHGAGRHEFAQGSRESGVTGSSATAAEVRSRIVAAAAAEVVLRGFDDFSIDRVATRSGVDPAVIRTLWADRRVLLMDAMLSTAEQIVPVPDTGSLREDLRALAVTLVALADTATGRRRFRRLLPNGRDADLTGVGADFWEYRFSAAKSILERAADRGELRAGIDVDDVIRMFSAALYYDVIYLDDPVRPEYADQVLDIFIRGIAR